jgi:hypothetical protein
MERTNQDQSVGREHHTAELLSDVAIWISSYPLNSHDIENHNIEALLFHTGSHVVYDL